MRSNYQAQCLDNILLNTLNSLRFEEYEIFDINRLCLTN